jgi:DNA-binding MarR family transcriptional regulator
MPLGQRLVGAADFVPLSPRRRADGLHTMATARRMLAAPPTGRDSTRYNEYIRVVAKSIQSEIQQTKPFSNLEEEAMVALQRTADQLRWRLSEMLKEHGLSPTQYNALRILRGAKDEGRACSEIAERMINRDPDITRLVDRLQRRGLVARSREDRDRRVITTRITPAGVELLESLDRPIADFNRKMLGPLGEPRLRTLLQLLEAAREQAS